MGRHNDNSDNEEDDDIKAEMKKSRSFTAYDVQKVRLKNLFANIDKPIEIPKRVEEKNFAHPPEFVRNVMGSSAGAGSGEFHVYRHLRRKEYARLHFIETQARNEELDEEYHKKLEENRIKAEESTAKKRAKRLKKKEKLKMAKKMRKLTTNDSNNDNNSDDDDDDKSEKDNHLSQIESNEQNDKQCSIPNFNDAEIEEI